MKQQNPSSNIINTVNDIINKGREKEILQLYTEDQAYNGRFITIKRTPLVNFGSCSYLGLEIDERLKAGAIDAASKYGIQYSSSRSYMSCTLYSELEELIRKIFNAPVVLAPTTTLGHQAVLSVVIEEGDAIIFDQQVHASVQYAAKHMQLYGASILVIRHNNLEELEAQIINLSPRHNRVWYMIDGIYSMYGDYAPVVRLAELLNKYPSFYLYVDDAHGMSWTGANGRGFTLSKTPLHSKMIIGSSFAKGFGTGGGVFVFPDATLCQKVRNCGGPLIFSGPNQIPVVGASIASAKIHLSGEIYQRQNMLDQKIKYCSQLLQQYNLPVISNPETPINFIGLGLVRVGYNMVRRMMDDGFYTNLAVFPAVPETCTGLRFTITLHHTPEDIENLVARLAFHLPKALAAEGRTIRDVHRAFRKVKNFCSEEKEPPLPLLSFNGSDAYTLHHETAIANIPQQLWDRLLGAGGSYDWKWLRLLENTFQDNALPENNWSFHYYLVRDRQNMPVLASFCIMTLSKDDMLAGSSVSYEVEQKRRDDPYCLCTKTMMMGSLLTEGSHLYIDRSRPDWKKIMMMLLDALWEEQAKQKAGVLCLRDFPDDDKEMDDFFMDQGFLKIRMPDHNIIREIKWRNATEYLQHFNTKSRKYIKDNVLKYEHFFESAIAADASPSDIKTWYRLYKNVKEKSFELNTFDLPEKLFENMARSTRCEVMQVSLKKEYSRAGQPIPVGVTFSILTTGSNYCGIIIGLDYAYVRTHNLYKYTLYRIVLRAMELNVKKLFLGFTASDVKRKFGATAVPQAAYIQVQDHYNLDVINSIAKSNS